MRLRVLGVAQARQHHLVALLLVSWVTRVLQDNGGTYESALAWAPYSNDGMTFM